MFRHHFSSHSLPLFRFYSQIQKELFKKVSLIDVLPQNYRLDPTSNVSVPYTLRYVSLLLLYIAVTLLRLQCQFADLNGILPN